MVALDLCRGPGGWRYRTALRPSRPWPRQGLICRLILRPPLTGVGYPQCQAGYPQRQARGRSDQIEGELVENRLLRGLRVLADQVDLAVRATPVVKAHDATVGR